jgi:hypothetical protein
MGTNLAVTDRICLIFPVNSYALNRGNQMVDRQL